MTIKSIVLSALSLMVSTGAVGQLQLSQFTKSLAKRPVNETATTSHIDSVYVMTTDGWVTGKQVWEYNESQQLSVVWQYTCHGQFGDDAIESELAVKDELYYNADGLEIRDDTYTPYRQELILTVREEVTECDGMVPITVVYSQLENGQLAPIIRRETKRYGDGLIYMYDVLMRQGQSWSHYMTGEVTYNSSRLPEEEVLTASQSGQTVEERLNCVYDWQDNLTCLTDCVSVDDVEYSSSVTNYVNTYDDMKRLVQVHVIPDDDDETLNVYFWSDGTTTALRLPHERQMEPASDFDLLGRHLPSVANRHEIRIMGGRKVFK